MWGTIIILAIGAIAWAVLWQQTQPDRSPYGMCDTMGCGKDATVHHGLEEWYCDACDSAYSGRS